LTTARVTLYTRAGCHLCEAVKQRLARARRRARFELEEIDIDSDPALRALYNEEVPVVAINGRKAFKYHLEEEEFLKKLRART
jgi:glutaredoxin